MVCHKCGAELLEGFCAERLQQGAGLEHGRSLQEVVANAQKQTVCNIRHDATG